MGDRPKARASKKAPRAPAKGRLGAYRAKRDLGVSGEPVGSGGAAGSAQPRFVIQKHDATRLHFDFRLEMEGVYRSWAVPKGLPRKPGAKVLAVEVEDHPLDYGSFEGTIPEGNYGAGTVMLWDRGFYSVEGMSPETGYREGKLHLALDGEKCHGEWTLVRMKGQTGEKSHWLMIKNSEQGRGSPFRSDGLDLSVKTGRSLDEISGGTSAPKTGKSASRLKPQVRRSRTSKRSEAEAPAGGKSAKPGFIEPMKALGVTEIMGTDWLLEIKYDGFRAIAVIDAGRVELWSRNEKPLTARFPEVAARLAELPCKNAVVDGEIVAVDDEGRPSFQRLQGVDSGKRRPPILYYIFDLLLLNGRSFIDEPLEVRREALEEWLKRTPDSVRVSPAFQQRAEVLLEEVQRRGLEGVVAKRRGSVYEPGRRSGSWVKRRVMHGQEFVVAGYTPPKGGRSHFGALLVGYFDNGELKYAGKVGAGFDANSLRALHARFRRIETDESPFAGSPPRPRDVTWLKPRLVAQVNYAEWTRDGLLRQPVFLGLREDKDAREVVREVDGR